MTYREACELFSSNTRISRSVESLVLTKPTIGQLENVCQVALNKGIEPTKVEEAKQAVKEHWNL